MVIAVVGFGVTLWNVARSIRAAERAKEAAKEARASARFLETLARWQAFNADKALGHVIASLEKT
ncbi:MAG: hypothetical protein FJX56_06290 [Alphaproteobacteria bacterium]|nr:hypothetical protein [Alphaproteobacteria bacterium]